MNTSSNTCIPVARQEYVQIFAEYNANTCILVAQREDVEILAKIALHGGAGNTWPP